MKLIMDKKEKFMEVFPVEALKRSKMVRDVIEQGRSFVVDLDTGMLTIKVLHRRKLKLESGYITLTEDFEDFLHNFLANKSELTYYVNGEFRVYAKNVPMSVFIEMVAQDYTKDLE